VTSPLLKSRNVEENGGSHTPEVVSTQEVVSGHLAAALRSMTSPFHDVIMAAGPLLIPHPFFRYPLLSLSDVATRQDHGTPTDAARRSNGGLDSASGSDIGNGSPSCDEDCQGAVRSVGVSSVLPLDLSPPRSDRVHNLRHHGNCSPCI